MTAFLITYSEYTRHFPDKRRAVKMALESAGAALLVLFLSSSICLWIIWRLTLNSN
jgi:hypothetical protein